MKMVLVMAVVVFVFGVVFFYIPREERLELLKIRVGNAELEVETARTDTERAQGLMWRTHLPQNNGMLFLFDAPRVASFWNKNTYIPLDLLWTRDNVVVDITYLPDVTSSGIQYTSSREEINAVIEVNAGFVQENNIAIGDVLVYE